MTITAATPLLKIVPYEKDRDGEEAGILWADGLMESLWPLYVETMLSARVLAILGGSQLLCFFLLSSSSWVKILPLLVFVLASVLIGLLGWTLKIRTKWTKKTRIEKTITSSDHHGKKKTILGQWVLLRQDGSHFPSNNSDGSSSKDMVLGCISVYKEEEANHQKDGSSAKETTTTNGNIMCDNNQDGRVVFWIAHATVDPSVRRQGWGNRLAAMAELHAQKAGAKTVRIVSGNAQTQPFWQRRGYKLIGTRWALLGHESVHMELDLSSHHSNNNIIEPKKMR